MAGLKLCAFLHGWVVADIVGHVLTATQGHPWHRVGMVAVIASMSTGTILGGWHLIKRGVHGARRP